MHTLHALNSDARTSELHIHIIFTYISIFTTELCVCNVYNEYIRIVSRIHEYIRLCICMHIYLHACKCTLKDVHVFVYTTHNSDICICKYTWICIRMQIFQYTFTCMHIYVHAYTYSSIFTCTDTGWRRLIGSRKMQIIFHKRATKYRSLLQKMTYKNRGSYESSPPCTMWYIFLNIFVYTTHKVSQIHEYIYEYVSPYFCTYIHTCTYTWICICMHIYMQACKCIFKCTCIYVHMYVYVCICICIYNTGIYINMCIHIYI